MTDRMGALNVLSLIPGDAREAALDSFFRAHAGDPLVIDKAVDRYRKGKRRLENAAEFYQVRLDDAHNATADAIAAGRVAQAIAKRWADELPATAAELHELQIKWSDANDASFEDFMRRQNPDFTITRGWPLKLSN